MDVVTFGETMVLFTPGSLGPLHFVNQFEKTIGGAESNLAIALSRLGHQVGWFSRLGNDEFGLYIRNYVRGEGVDTSRVIFDESYPTAVFFKERQMGSDPKIYYYRKGSAASQMKPNDVDEAYINQAKFLHLTGITPALSHSCMDTVFHTIKIAKKNGVTVVFDPNIRLKLWSKEEAGPVLREIASKCDIILPGLEEGEIITGKSTPEEIASALIQNGAKVVVVKLGENGAYYALNEQEEYVEGYPVKQIVDTVGAGDGFAAGFLSGLIRGWSYREAVRLGNRIGAYALSVAGDVEGYPFWNQIDPEREKKEVFR
ncbi:MAG TPA: sugar kinase [Bacillota bacterium]|nr:sugar kinase [Bacillota bacterium]